MSSSISKSNSVGRLGKLSPVFSGVVAGVSVITTGDVSGAVLFSITTGWSLVISISGCSISISGISIGCASSVGDSMVISPASTGACSGISIG